MRRRWAVVALAVAAALLVLSWWSRPQRAERTAVLMDTPVRVVVYAPRSRAEAAADAAMAEVSRLDLLWDPHQPQSDVARVNAAAGLAPVPVSPETVELASLALQVARESGGAFDPTIRPLSAVWGFGESASEGFVGAHTVPDAAERASALALVNWRDLQVDPDAGTLYLTREGMGLEFGAIAKGYAARLVRDRLAAESVQAALVQLGGSIALLGQRPEGGAWQIAVQHPRLSDQYLATLSLTGGFADTAGDYQRYFEHDGVRYHHILDPATGAPARGMASVTVVAPQGEWADAYATAAFVLGMDEGYRFLVDHGVEGLLVSDRGEVRLTPGMADLARVDVGSWPE